MSIQKLFTIQCILHSIKGKEVNFTKKTRIQDTTPDFLWVGTLLLVDTQLTLACGRSQCFEHTPVLECSWGGSDQMCSHSVPSEHHPESSAVASHSKKE